MAIVPRNPDSLLQQPDARLGSLSAGRDKMARPLEMLGKQVENSLACILGLQQYLVRRS
jgi:hypothetical protein